MSMIGKTLGTFECTALLGKGGMGEVYKAKDQKLGRDVAIKVLPEEFAKDTDRVARFQREAKLLASLNHPNIAAIHGLEEFDSTHFLVLELIEGDTLADRLKHGAIPVEESLKLALQIAEALEAAHEKGVIHRDLKPANIKVTPEGKVKVLDFGLAKAFAGNQEEANLSHSPTLSAAATQQGVILGTAAYMSPEQAKGKTLDRRTDIWAFGCVLYEMLAGQAAYQGDDVTEILAAVVKLDANMDLLPAKMHPRIREVLIRCLQKEQKRRYPEISQAQYEIEQVLADPGGIFVQPVTAAKSRKKLRVGLPWVAAVFILGAVLAGLAVWMLRLAEPLQIVRFEYSLPEGQELTGNGLMALAVSADGKQFVYGTSKGLYLRPVSEMNAKFISGTEGPASQPFFSPDGRWVGYFSDADRKLKKIDVNGGSPVTLCDDILQLSGASWNEDKTILFGQIPGGIKQVSEDGGTPEHLFGKEGETLVAPQMLPDGKSVLFTNFKSAPYSIMVHSLESGESRELFAGALGRYVPTGHIVYRLINDSKLFAVPFDHKKLEFKGGHVPIGEGVMQSAVSESGTLVFVPGSSPGASVDLRTLVWVDRNGKEVPLDAEPNAYVFPRISPNGERIALTIGGNMGSNLWVWDIIRKTSTRLTYDEATDIFPLWTPDSKRIAFCSIAGGGNNINWKAADGSGESECLISLTDELLFPSSWSQDGKTMILEQAAGSLASLFMSILPTSLTSRDFTLQASASTLVDIVSLTVDEDRTVLPLLQGKFAKVNPVISPDGRYMAYASFESGQFEVYVRPFPQVESQRWTISRGGGDQPRWSGNGHELFYRNGDAMMAVSINTEAAFSAGEPEELFRAAYYSLIGHNWDVSPDGKRFLMIKRTADAGSDSASAGPRKINIVLNWFEELKERVPAN